MVTYRLYCARIRHPAAGLGPWQRKPRSTGVMHLQTAPLRFNPSINAPTLLLAPSNVTDPSDGGDVIRSFLITVLHPLRVVRLSVRFGVVLTGCMRSDWLPDRGVRAVATKATVDGGHASQTAPIRFNPPTAPSDRHVSGSLYCGHSNEKSLPPSHQSFLGH